MGTVRLGQGDRRDVPRSRGADGVRAEAHMAGVKLTAEAKARLKLLTGFCGGYYPNEAIDRDTVIDWAISSYAPLDCDVVWNGKNYAVQCRVCGFAALREATMLRHLRQGCESPESTLDMPARAGENEAGDDEPSISGLGPVPDESTLDIQAGPALERQTGSSKVFGPAEEAEQPLPGRTR